MQPSSTSITFIADDGTVLYGAEAQAAMIAVNDADQAHNEALLSRMTPEQVAQLERHLRERAAPPPDEVERTRALWRLRRARKASGGGLVAPGGTTDRTGERAREARPRVRAGAQRSSARSGDSGEDDPGEPPRGRRLNSRAEINAWAVERKAALDALILAEGLGQQQLSFDERRVA